MTSVPASDAVSWPRKIRRYTLLLITLVALFGVVTTGYVWWEKRRSEEFLLVMDEFHFASAFHCAIAREEARRILVHVHDTLSHAGGAEHSAAIENHFNLLSSLHIVRDKVDAILNLQERFDDPRFGFLTLKLRNDFSATESGAARLSAAETEPEEDQVNAHLEALMTTLNQLERLHFIIYEELKVEHEAQKSRGVVVLFASALMVLLIGFLSVRKGLQAIAAVIANQTKTEQELRAAKAEAESANAAKSEFLASMSHELRTPLNSVLGFSQVLGSSELARMAENKRIEYARDIQKAGEHLLALVEDILDLSKVEAGEAALSETACDLSDILNDAARMVQGLAERKMVALDVEHNLGLPLLFADKRRVTQIVVNLMSNAVKFNKVNGRVKVHAHLDAGGALAISVCDTGIGIPAGEIARVFEPFGQVRTSATVAHEGTGLGLSLSKKLAELHGGRITLESEVGIGTQATVLFPSERTVSPRRSQADGALTT